MSSYAILRAEKLKTFGNIGGSLSHNYRTRETHNADASRTPKNMHTVGSAQEVMERIKARLPQKRRKDAVLCIEYMIASSPGALKSDKDHRAYLADALAWLKERHGAENVISATIHFDETTPHLCAYVIPLDAKGVLNAKSFLGGKKVLSEMQSDFAKKVGEKHGLERGIERSTATHTSIKEWYGMLAETAAPVLVPAAAVVPKVLEKRLLKSDIVETPEQVAERLNRVISSLMKPLEARAKMSALDKKKAQELQDMLFDMQKRSIDATHEASQAKAETQKMREVFDYLTPDEQKSVVLKSKKNKRIRDRCVQIIEGAFSGVSAPVRRFVDRAKQALARVSGQWWGVDWRDFDRTFIAEESVKSDKKTAVAVVLEHSPGTASLSKIELAALRESVMTSDVAASSLHHRVLQRSDPVTDDDVQQQRRRERQR